MSSSRKKSWNREKGEIPVKRKGNLRIGERKPFLRENSEELPAREKKQEREDSASSAKSSLRA